MNEQRIQERRNFTDWTSLEHKFPNESIGATFIEVALDRVRADDPVNEANLRGRPLLLDSDHLAVGTFTKTLPVCVQPEP
jgi:hypothetical protein